MKKTILSAALGFVVSVAPAYGQGSIFFNNYGTTTDAIITCAIFGGGSAGPATGLNASLWYSFGGGPLTALGNSTAFNPAIPGYFTGPIVTIPGYTGGPISFKVTATGPGPFGTVYGESAVFTLDSIATGTQPVGELGPAFKPFTVAYCVPEPSTVALVCLGLVSLLIFRRRRS